MKKAMVLWVALSLAIVSVQGCASARHSGDRGPAASPTSSIDVSKIKVLGGDESSFQQQPGSNYDLIRDPESYDAIVVGSGLAGLSAATFLTDPKYSKKVLILEKEDHVGGLASGGLINGEAYSRGAAYWTDTYEEEQKILESIGLGNFRKELPIPEPIDSYWVRGKLYRGIWSPTTLRKLPGSFELFRHELIRANDENLIPNQPFEEFEKYGGKMDLDRISAAQWIRGMPEITRSHTDKRSRKILARYDSDLATGRMNANDPMIDVIELMDLYCRSALGNTSEHISAMAFANFYISEIVTRYTSSVGTSIAAMEMASMLGKRSSLATIRKSAPVIKIINQADHAEVQYLDSKGQVHQVDAKYVIFSAQLKLAPKLIDGLAAQSPEQAELMSSLGYAHYSVHGVEVKGHPYKGAYDTWVHASDYSEADFTDFILGDWVATDGYKKSTTKADSDIFTIYHPLPQSALGHYSSDDAARLAAGAVDRLLDVAQPLLDPAFTSDPDWKNRSVSAIYTNMWPYSVHIAEPGHYINKVKILRKPFGRVYFANNNLGTPAFEEALFRGHCGANNVLKHLVPNFKQEKWSRCPLE